VPLHKVINAFSLASVELWSNLTALFTGDPVNWLRLGEFFRYVFLPYLVGGIIPGIITGLVAYYVTYPLILSYQRGRIHRLKQRFEKRRRAIEAGRAQAAAKERLPEGADGGAKVAKVTRGHTGPREAE
jgi:hypothetical protein